MIDLYIDDLFSFFDKGGLVLYFVFFLAIILWTLLIERYMYVSFTYKKEKKAIIKELKNIHSQNRFKDEIKRYFLHSSSFKLKSGLDLIKTMIMVCPLIGLLGTVTGMIEVFDVMAITGSSDVKSMANGVSMATIPTMAGMAVALSGILFEKKLELSIRYKIQKFELELSKVI
ncbi:MotA/TolQ/ExbB proton channel [Arcobacter nitrofigilis DSM 7299]|uniref:MotA/TolQ/ExbB proton channel n=1 Tax=Arcobacter nitrofigilis (strain ATCC 33309 / DSM 7299 / CCUG 15893 / LMG 7604 / NCTC 12251 / CI) TaxID=572480 RepID=D5UZJ3_ARCNC|nr:MotA/TolQ/ExbB proton channel family protein [Arcobacter nitrofigilis]ADG92230.1 MotA/TolQ/ExbB proton channel [Arcobacter nitrofigilis DSM 7299]